VNSRFSSRKGFTLVEVLLAASILAFATFGILGLLKLSDQMAFRARADGKGAQIFKSRTLSLVSLPVPYFRHIVVSRGGAVPSNGVWKFERGSSAELTPGGKVFPFWGVSNPDEVVYLFKSRPLPGQKTLRSIFPYEEAVELSFFYDRNARDLITDRLGLGSARSMRVVYFLKWKDSFAGQDRVLKFEFIKNAL
jgi:prepilin-type N-terminal cleavage/methylation domain-containing protein